MAKKTRREQKKEKLQRQSRRRRQKAQSLRNDKPKLIRVDPNSLPKEIFDKWEKCKKEEKERENLGIIRPIIHADFKGKKFVAVGNQLTYSNKWKTFIDFLVDYPSIMLGSDWGMSEMKKPHEERHQIINWYVEMCHFQKRQKVDEGGLYAAIPNGSFLAYILLAYDLYLLRHHSAIQEDIIRRLKTTDQFQGARYELLTASTCIRAGFSIEYEDEKDHSRSHVEFIATHKITGQKICVEAKSRHRKGVLGQPGTEKDLQKMRVRIGSLLNSALSKEHGHPLVVFIDLNLPPKKVQEVFAKPISNEFKKIIDNIDKTYGSVDKFNLIVFTNCPHHYGKEDEDAPPMNVGAILSQNPEIIPDHLRSITNIFDAANTYGRVPNEFPKED